jgi:hypothetical protein
LVAGPASSLLTWPGEVFEVRENEKKRTKWTWLGLGVIQTGETKKNTDERAEGGSIDTHYVVKIYIPGDQEGLFKLAIQLRKCFNWVIYKHCTRYVLLVYLTNI